MSTFHNQVKYFKSDMKQMCKLWNNSNPSLPDVASSIRSWIKDMEKMAIHEESNTPSFAKAYTHLKSAYDYRDDKQKSIKMAELALKELETLEKEGETPEYKSLHQRRAAKSVWGEDGFYENNQDSRNAEIYKIQRKIESFMIKGAGNIQTSSVNAVKSDLQSIIDSLPYDSSVRKNTERTMQMIDRAWRSKNTSHQFNRDMGNAIKSLDGIAVMIDERNRPEGYIASLNNHDIRDLNRKIKAIKSLLSQYDFYQPYEVSKQALRKAQELKSAIKSRKDIKAERMADVIEKHIMVINQVSNNPRIKSLNPNVWNAPEVSESLELGLEALDSLQNHLSVNY